ncbi:hypothetical protein chiPu_0029026 [Chiloscyllium punctatum]|uniref:Uncharacterized protein n=1 Tax=Chiloscyllium punctatum TaxID=137246 RepID=A0A401TPZ7_CHIPU|nr:hypothetical protein [Chiloscyllium punctatum]
MRSVGVAILVLVVVSAAMLGLATGRCPGPQQLRHNCVCASLYKRPNCNGRKLQMDIPFNANVKRLAAPFHTFATVVVAKGCKLITFSKLKYRGTASRYRPGVTRVRRRRRNRQKVRSLCCICPKF